MYTYKSITKFATAKKSSERPAEVAASANGEMKLSVTRVKREYPRIFANKLPITAAKLFRAF
jgi:hypothetical protein